MLYNSCRQKQNIELSDRLFTYHPVYKISLYSELSKKSHDYLEITTKNG